MPTSPSNARSPRWWTAGPSCTVPTGLGRKTEDSLKPERIRVVIEQLEDGRMVARSPDHGVLAHGEDLEDLRRRVDDVVRARYGDNVRIALMVGKTD